MSCMMDTCAFIWYVLDDERLPDDVKDIIISSDEVYLSYATLLEITIKQTIGKLDEFKWNIMDLAELCMDNGIMILPMKLSYLAKLRQLPLIHRDPFDRIITATAIVEDYTLLTCDSEIVKYAEVKTLWKITKEEN